MLNAFTTAASGKDFAMHSAVDSVLQSRFFSSGLLTSTRILPAIPSRNDVRVGTMAAAGRARTTMSAWFRAVSMEVTRTSARVSSYFVKSRRPGLLLPHTTLGVKKSS